MRRLVTGMFGQFYQDESHFVWNSPPAEGKENKEDKHTPLSENKKEE